MTQEFRKQYPLGFDLQLFADGEAGGENQGENGGKADESGKGSAGEKGTGDGKSGGGESKTFTQAEVDQMVKDRLARETKKHQKALDDLKKSINGEQAGDSGDAGKDKGDDNQQASKESAAAQEALTKAHTLLVAASAKAEAVALGVDPKYVSDVVRLADLSQIQPDELGNVDASKVSAAINEVLKRVPIFKKTEDNAGGFRLGGAGGNAGSANGWGNNAQQQQGTPGAVQAKRWNKNRY